MFWFNFSPELFVICSMALGTHRKNPSAGVVPVKPVTVTHAKVEGPSER